MDIFFSLLPGAFTAIISVILMSNAEKNEDSVDKFWGYIAGIIFVWITIFLMKAGIDYSAKAKSLETENKIEFFDDYYY